MKTEQIKKELIKFAEWYNKGRILSEIELNSIDKYLQSIETEQENCKCCDGTGIVEGDHFNDKQPCRTCNGGCKTEQESEEKKDKRFH